MSSVNVELLHEVEQFLYREARLLDAEQFDGWLEMLTEDIHYWMPSNPEPLPPRQNTRPFRDAWRCLTKI